MRAHEQHVAGADGELVRQVDAVTEEQHQRAADDAEEAVRGGARAEGLRAAGQEAQQTPALPRPQRRVKGDGRRQGVELALHEDGGAKST